jgi:hypothetical protein
MDFSDTFSVLVRRVDPRTKSGHGLKKTPFAAGRGFGDPLLMAIHLVVSRNGGKMLFGRVELCFDGKIVPFKAQ